MADTFTKDPSDVLDYQGLYASWLGSDTIATSTWVLPSGLTKDSDSFTDTTTTVWLSGGTAKSDYTVVNRITTAAGRTRDKSITVTCGNR